MYVHLLKTNQIIIPWSLECLLNKIHFCNLFLAAAGDHSRRQKKISALFHGTVMIKMMYSLHLDSNIASAINVKLTTYCATKKQKKSIRLSLL